jgi:usherin
LEGYFYLQQNNSFLCLPCHCDRTGTVNGSLLCDKSTGQCPCKLGIMGLQCNQCEHHRYNVTMGNLQGCQMCECDSLETLPGTICDPISGLCLPNRQWQRCNHCQPGKRKLPYISVGTYFPFLSPHNKLLLCFWFGDSKKNLTSTLFLYLYINADTMI